MWRMPMECQVVALKEDPAYSGLSSLEFPQANPVSFISHISLVYASLMRCPARKLSTFRSVSLGFLPFYDFILCMALSCCRSCRLADFTTMMAH